MAPIFVKVRLLGIQKFSGKWFSTMSPIGYQGAQYIEKYIKLHIFGSFVYFK